MNNFITIGCCLLMSCANLAQGQSNNMAMHQHHRRPPKNIFIKMMDSMMLNMDTVKINPSADVSFFRLMRPHHQAALEMAAYEIRYGKNSEMRSLAKSILAEQTIEINLMTIWEKTIIRGGDADMNFKKGMDNAMEQMMDSLPWLAPSAEVDYAFAAVMKPHHQAGVEMAKAALGAIKNQQTISFTKKLISEEQIEIDQMSNYLKEKK